jgi:hypothetical protein
LLFLTGCRSNGPSPPSIESFGMVELTVDRPILQSAIRTADLVLGPSAPVRLTPGWTQSPAGQPIRVFAVTPQGLSKRDVMTSYQQCHCVVAQVGRVTEWLQTGMGSRLLAIDLKSVLAYMLLHEAGHIAHGDINSANAFDDTSSGAGRLNLDPTTQKDRENAADRFAADAIASGIREKGTDRGLAAARLSVVLAQLSWNLAEHRLLDNFGGTEANLSSLFLDAGLSHPNLEWRILVVNDAISHSRDSQQLLNDFECHRHHEPSILFQAHKP